MEIVNFLDVVDGCEFAALTQVSTGPLTAFFALKLCGLLGAKQLTIHLIGAEMEFEVDVFQKWEIFLLHILPALETLHIVFIGPELNPNNISFDQLSTIRCIECICICFSVIKMFIPFFAFRCCRLCRKAQRTIQYHFENRLYHDYYMEPDFLKPDLGNW